MLDTRDSSLLKLPYSPSRASGCLVLGDDRTALRLGTPVFTRGLDDAEDENIFYHNYYEMNSDTGFNDSFTGSPGTVELGAELSRVVCGHRERRI